MAQGWYKPKMTEHNLGKFGQPDQIYEAIDVNSLPYGEMEDMLALRSKLEKDPDTAANFLRELVHKLFQGKWTIMDPMTGEPLKPPADDPDSYKRIPVEVLMHMVAQTMGGESEAEADVPPESGSKQ